MEIKSYDKVISGNANATVTMDKGDTLSIAFKDTSGEYQVINVAIQGCVAVVTHEQSDDTMVVRRRGSQFVKA
jgi:hypothetical protein